MKRILVLGILLLPLLASAMPEESNIRLNGFGTFAAAKSNSDVPVLSNREITEEWCFDCDSTLGAQLMWQPNAYLKTGVQVVKRPQDHFSGPELERAYVEYRWKNSKLTAGRLRVPLFIHSESYFVSSGYPWLRLPAEVYSNTLGITYYDGIAFNWNGAIGDRIFYSISPYASLSREETITMYRKSFTFKAEDTYGVTTDVYIGDHLLHASWLTTKAEQSAFGPSGRYNLQLFSFGSSLSFDPFTVYSEVLISEEFHANWYISTAYNIGSWTPYITYSQGRRSLESNSYLLGTRFDLSTEISLNLEWQHINGPDNFINGQFTQAQNPTQPVTTSVDLVSLGLTFTF